MKLPKLAAALCLLPLLAAPVAGQPADAATAKSCTQRVVTKSISVTDASAPGGKRQVLVFRPPGPDSRRLPVLYFLHGGPGTARDVLASGIQELMNARICAGQRFVVAVPDGTTVAKPDGSWWDNEWADDPAGNFDLESFITGPLIKAVEGSLTRPSSERAMGGFSMGGFGAAAIALRHPGLYGSVIGIAGYYTHLDDPDHALGTTTAMQDKHLPSLLLGNAKKQHWLLMDGRQENNDVVTGETQKMTALMKAKHDDVTETLVTGEHTWQMVGAALPKAVAWWRGKLPKSAG